MRTLLKSVFTLAICTLAINANTCIAQCNDFIPAVVTENTSLCSSGVNTIYDLPHTGNDIREPYVNSNLPNMEVSVWDGLAPGLSWLADAGGTIYTCSLPLPSGTNDPDVVLVESYNATIGKVTWYAVIVYADAGNNCICDLYYWNNNQFNQYTTGYPITLKNSNNSANASYHTAINVDANDRYDIAIIWDDAIMQDIEIITAKGYSGGVTPPSFCPTANGIGQGTRASNTGNGEIMPDVAVYNNGGRDEMFYTYLDASQTNIYVDYDSWGSFCNIGAGSSNEFTSTYTGGTNYFYPRIACPPVQNSSFKDWSVVVSWDKSGTGNAFFDIYNITNRSGSLYYNVYTDNSQGLCAINDVNNVYPVVSYDYNTSGIMVGWTANYYQTSNFNPIGCVAVNCDTKGGLMPSCYSPSLAYLIVSTNNLIAHENSWALSLSGRHFRKNDPIFYTFFHLIGGTGDVPYKTVTFCSPSLRKSNQTTNNNNTNNNIGISPNPFTENLYVTLPDQNGTVLISDIAGKTILKLSGMESEINAELNRQILQFTKGIYFIRINDSGSEDTFIEKIVKM